jgi:hypothetical protein
MDQGTIYDGFTTIVAQDADTHPSFLPSGYVAESVNRAFRGGIDKTRPMFRYINLVPGAGQSDTIVNDIRSSNFQGAKDYKSVNDKSRDGIIASFGGVIYFIAITGNFGQVFKIAEGNDSTLMHTWFCQAEEWIYIQNGYQNPIAWNGDLNTPSERLNPAAKQMPIGTIMCYAFGRVFVSNKYNQIYASDIIFGAGFTDTKNTRNFTETTYWAEGGAFNTPATMGNITALNVMPVIGANDRGQGMLVVLTENGAFSLNVSVPRDLWKDNQIQRVSLLGRGCLSPYTALVNGELWFRSSDGWAFYSNTQGDYNRYFVLRKLSREVGKWVSKDTPWLKQFASSCFFDNYILSTVSPQVERNGEALNRYHRGMVVLDLDLSSSPAPDAAITFRWNGLWTGIRPTHILSATINQEARAFAFSYDVDKNNRLYEITSQKGDDYGENGPSKIKSFFTTGRYDFSSTQKTNKFIRKKLTGGDLWISGIENQIEVEMEYRSDSSKCWNQLLEPTILGCNSCDPILSEECVPQQSAEIYKKLILTTPDDSDCTEVEDIPAVEGAEFQVKLKLTGSATVDRMRLMANIKSNEASPVGSCANEQDLTCKVLSCCEEVYYDYNIN